MKKLLIFFAIILLNSFTIAQNINVSLSAPTAPFQDADIGAMDFGDIDNDGDQDLIITGKGGPIATTLYLNDGTGNFTAATGTPFINVYGGTVEFANVNNDNFVDLLITGASFATRTANLYINNGNGTFSIATSPITPSSDGDFAFGDIDNDNDLDLIITGLNTGNIGFTSLFINDGNGNFSVVSNTPFEQLSLSSVVFIDIENDGDNDILLSGKNSSNMEASTLYVNNGSGTFTLNAINSFIGVSSGDIAVSDSDNDGDTDILFTGSTTTFGNVTKLYANSGSGTFSEVTGTTFIGTFVSATEFSDFDNDGDDDILLVGAGNFNGLSALALIYQNQGNNSFTLSNELIATYLASIAIGDIDGDNDVDFLIGGTHFTAPIRNPKLYVNNLNSPLDILDAYNGIEVSFFPNPATDFVNFNTGNSIEKITVFNVLGEVVLSRIVNVQKYQMDVSMLSPGSYFAKLEHNRQSKTIKFLKY